VNLLAIASTCVFKWLQLLRVFICRVDVTHDDRGYINEFRRTSLHDPNIVSYRGSHVVPRRGALL
jgi:hypothetical protein